MSFNRATFWSAPTFNNITVNPPTKSPSSLTTPRMYLPYLLLFLSLLRPSHPQPSHRGRKSLHNRSHRDGHSSREPSPITSLCKEKCDSVEALLLRPLRKCALHKRLSSSHSTKRGKTVGETCTDTFMKQFHLMCVDTCVEHQSVTSGGGEYIFPQPRVAKCTGLGGGVYFESCSDGYFDAITQTLEGLGAEEFRRGRLFLSLSQYPE